MFFFFNSKFFNKLNSDIIFISLINYIITIAYIKFLEHKNSMTGFFNIYLILIILIYFIFTLFYYIQNNFINITKLDFINQKDDLITEQFDFNKFNNELNEFKKKFKNKIKIIKKSSSESEIKKFNSNINEKKDISNSII